MTTFRAYLLPEAKEKIEQKQDGRADMLGTLRVDYDYGNPYVTLGDPVDPAFRLPQVLDPKLVDYFSLKDQYYVGFKSDGLYKTKTAVARLETYRSVDPNGGPTHVDQRISVVGRDLKSILDCYGRIRSGTLKPKQDWGTYDPKIFEAAAHGFEPPPSA